MLIFYFAPSPSIAMTAVNKNCSGCGASEDLHQCPTCAERMNGKGMSQALCVTCVSDTDIISTFGGKVGADVLGFICNACSKSWSVVAYLQGKLVVAFDIQLHLSFDISKDVVGDICFLVNLGRGSPEKGMKSPRLPTLRSSSARIDAQMSSSSKLHSKLECSLLFQFPHGRPSLV